jgi:thiamine-phosphate pyrophosphorylase
LSVGSPPLPALPRLVVITDWALGHDALLERLERALDAGPEVAVQHREKGVTTREYAFHANELAALCSRKGCLLFVSGRVDLAIALGAHLHLASTGPPFPKAAPFLPGRLLSFSVHDLREAGLAAGASFALVSPVRPPGSKPDDTRPPLGISGFQALAAALPCPAFALGGVTPELLAELRPAGAAVISAVLRAEDPLVAARHCLAALGVSGG